MERFRRHGKFHFARMLMEPVRSQVLLLLRAHISTILLPCHSLKGIAIHRVTDSFMTSSSAPPARYVVKLRFNSSLNCRHPLIVMRAFNCAHKSIRSSSELAQEQTIWQTFVCFFQIEAFAALHARVNSRPRQLKAIPLRSEVPKIV